jgi:NADH:ubiquinone oxidoreductase subunit 4 (subunit M)
LVGDLFYVCIVFAFLVKIPIFIVHLWLPRAHVEAPVSCITSIMHSFSECNYTLNFLSFYWQEVNLRNWAIYHRHTVE